MKKLIFNREYELLEKTDEIYDVSNEVTLPRVSIDNEWWVCLPEGLTIVRLRYGLLKLYLNDRFHLPEYLWENVRVGFLDDDTGNLDVDNLFPIFPEGGIDYPDLEGFKYIPGYEHNAINSKGIVLRIPRFDLNQPVMETNPTWEDLIYPENRILVNEKTLRTRKTHRLLALAFKNPPDDYPKLMVDHLNNDKSDFSLDNIEWVEASENNNRAFIEGCRTDNNIVLVYDWKTSETRTFHSQWEVVREVGISSTTLSLYLAAGGVYGLQYSFKHLGDNRTWEEVGKTHGKVKKFKAKHVLTGEVVTLESVQKAIGYLKSSSSVIMKQTMSKESKLILNGYEVKSFDDASDWHEFSYYDLEVYKLGLPNTTPVYKVMDLETNVEKVYYGISPVLKIIGCVKRTLIVKAKKGGVIGKRYKVEKLR